jgi:hypothetical protein
VGSGFRTFTAGEVLTASNVQNYLMDQSVMVFGGSAARSSAIGTANFEEGMVSYLTDTDKVEAYNGTNWAQVGASAQGLTLINTTSFSAVASQSVNDVFSATYNNYLILFNNLTMSSDGWMNMRMRVSAADETGANYRYQELSASSTTVAGARATGQTAWANINYAQTGNQNPNTLTIFNPFATSPTSIVSSQAPVSNGNIEVFAKSFGLNTTTSYTGFSFYPASAGPTLTGSVSVYGYNK